MRVVIVEDEKLFSDLLTGALRDKSVDVVAQAASVEQALRAVSDSTPDAALIDIRLPPTKTDEGLRLAEALRLSHPDVALLVLSAISEVAYAKRLLDLRPHSRSIGYLLKNRVAKVDELVEALNRVTSGGVAIDKTLVSQRLGQQQWQDPLAKLTPREREILPLVAEGWSNSGIAAQLNIAKGTVEKYLVNIANKANLHGSVSLARQDENVRVMVVLMYQGSSGSATQADGPAGP